MWAYTHTTCVCVYICSGRTEAGRGEREREREDELEDYGQLSELSMCLVFSCLLSWNVPYMILMAQLQTDGLIIY